MCVCVCVYRAVLQYYQSGGTREYTVSEGHRLHMECNAPRSSPNATYSWSVARDVDSNPRPVIVGHRVQIDSQGMNIHLIIICIVMIVAVHVMSTRYR